MAKTQDELTAEDIRKALEDGEPMVCIRLMPNGMVGVNIVQAKLSPWEVQGLALEGHQIAVGWATGKRMEVMKKAQQGQRVIPIGAAQLGPNGRH